MLKTIRKTIVGMMNQLRIARSLMPRPAACVDMALLLAAGPVNAGCDMGKAGSTTRRNARGADRPPRALDDAFYFFVRPYFLNVASQSLARPLSASSAVPRPPTTNGCHRLLAAVSNSAYSGTPQKSLTMNIDW